MTGPGAPGAPGTPGTSLGAVVVNHEAGPALLACVDSLRRAGIGEVAVVDNASGDGSLEALAAADPDVVLVPTGANLGFGAAANRGVAATRADLVLVCNPDLVVEPDAPLLLAGALRADPALAVAGPAVLDPTGARYPSARAFPSPVVAVLHALLGQRFPSNPWSRRYKIADDPGEARDADWVSGACLLVRRDAFEALGGFDEGYFMYVEDLDLCWRLGRAGWRVRYVPAARVVHAQGVSTRRHPYRMLVAHHRSAWRFARRTTRGPARVLLPGVAVVLAGRLVASAAGLAASRRGRGGRPEAAAPPRVE